MPPLPPMNHRRIPSPGVRTGAALIEVLVGLIVAALLLTPLARGVASAVHGYAVASSRDRGAALQSFQLGLSRADPCGPSASGDTTARGVQVDWSAAPDSTGVRELRSTLSVLGADLTVVGGDGCW